MADGLHVPSAKKSRPQMSESAPSTVPSRTTASTEGLRRERAPAACLLRWANNYWASIRGGNWFEASGHEGTEHNCRQNRNPDCQLCIHLLHCRAPLGPGIFLLG